VTRFAVCTRKQNHNRLISRDENNLTDYADQSESIVNLLN